MAVGMVVVTRLPAGAYSSDMLVGARGAGRMVGRRGVLRSLSSRQSRVGVRAAHEAGLLSGYEGW